MPPVMGVAAFILAAMTGVPYGDVIVAATLPAIAYFICLFLSASFQARKQKIEAFGSLTEDMRVTRQDILHLCQIFLPILLILVLLLTPKDSVGCGWIGWLLGADAVLENGRCNVTSLPWLLQVYQNAAGDAGATGWWAAALVMVLLFLDKEFRAQPRKLLDALAEAGITISTLYLMLLAVTVKFRQTSRACRNLSPLMSWASFFHLNLGAAGRSFSSSWLWESPWRWLFCLAWGCPLCRLTLMLPCSWGRS